MNRSHYLELLAAAALLGAAIEHRAHSFGSATRCPFAAHTRSSGLRCTTPLRKFIPGLSRKPPTNTLAGRS
jgi:hypothetical protein